MFADRLRNIFAHAAQFAQKTVQQRKVRRGAIVAAIAAGGLLGFDYVVTGGPDWNPIGADAPRFELVASAAASEHPLLPPSFAAEPAPVLLDHTVVVETAVDVHDPNVSADDLLGAPVYARAVSTDVELTALLDSLKPQRTADIEALVQPLAARAEWWR